MLILTLNRAGGLAGQAGQPGVAGSAGANGTPAAYGSVNFRIEGTSFISPRRYEASLTHASIQPSKREIDMGGIFTPNSLVEFSRILAINDGGKFFFFFFFLLVP